MANRLTSGKIDIPILSIYIGLVLIGWLMIYTVGYGEDGYDYSDFLSTSAGKQALWIIISFFTFFIIQLLDSEFWQTFAYPIYGATLLLLALVLVFGVEIKGATSWFRVASFTLQPSEFAKVGTTLGIAAFLSHYNTDLRKSRYIGGALALIGAPIFLILMQPDAGSAIVFLSFFIVFFRAGLSASFYVFGFFSAGMLILGLLYNPLWIVISLAIIILSVLLVNISKNRMLPIIILTIIIGCSYYIFSEINELQYYLLAVLIVSDLILAYLNYQKRRGRLAGLLLLALVYGAIIVYGANFSFNNILKPHQQARINVWLHPEKANNKDEAYNLYNSKIAIGSGGWQGKGFLNGSITKGGFVPEQETDFIFSTIGEEQGFIGAAAIIILFLLLIYRISRIAERQKSAFGKYFAYGVAGIFFIHFFINIGMTMGIMPVVGIPLPFISKGGSALLGFTILISIMLKFDSTSRA